MSPSGRRLLALAIMFGAAGFVSLAIAMPVIGAFSAQSDAIAQSQQTLAAYERRAAMRPAVEAALKEMTRREARLNDSIEGTSTELAASNVQNLVKSIVESDQVQVESVQNLPPADTGGFQYVDVQYDLTVPMTRLKDVVYRIETNVPFLFLENVDVRGPDGIQTVDPNGVPPSVHVHWVVRGYRRLRAP